MSTCGANIFVKCEKDLQYKIADIADKGVTVKDGRKNVTKYLLKQHRHVPTEQKDEEDEEKREWWDKAGRVQEILQGTQFGVYVEDGDFESIVEANKQTLIASKKVAKTTIEQKTSADGSCRITAAKAKTVLWQAGQDKRVKKFADTLKEEVLGPIVHTIDIGPDAPREKLVEELKNYKKHLDYRSQMKNLLPHFEPELTADEVIAKSRKVRLLIDRSIKASGSEFAWLSRLLDCGWTLSAALRETPRSILEYVFNVSPQALDELKKLVEQGEMPNCDEPVMV